MADSLRRRLKPFYRNRLLPIVRSVATAIFRLGVDVAASMGAMGAMGSRRRVDAESFLIVNLAGHLGDTVMLLPMIEALRRAHPEARIEAAVEAAAAPLLRQVETIDRVHAFKLPGQPPTTLWLSIARAAAILRQWWPLRRDLRPSTVILPRWGDDLFRSTTLGYLTQAPRRIGFASNVLGGMPAAPYRDALLTRLVGGGSGMHEPARFVYLLEQAALIPPSDPGAVSASSVESLCAAVRKLDFAALSLRLGLPQRYAVLAPGASMPRRVYPIESWLPAIEQLARKGLQTVLLAGPADAAIARRLHALCSRSGLTTVLAGTTTIAESAAILSCAEGFLGNDSGPGHLAGALGTPSIVLFIAEPSCDPNLPAAPERVRPVGPHLQVLRPERCLPPCAASCTASEAHCIAAIAPESVALAARSFGDARFGIARHSAILP